ncbi:MAG TPA: hypothetical protein VF407_10640 [Polyangiaceae bacterium]
MRSSISRFSLSAPLLGVVALLAIGCNTAEQKTYYQGDASTGCATTPEIDCEATTASTQSCTATAGASGNEGQLPTSTAYPAGCQAYFRDVDCSSLGFCTCDAADDAGNAAFWNCHEGTDGGS